MTHCYRNSDPNPIRDEGQQHVHPTEHLRVIDILRTQPRLRPDAGPSCAS